MQLLRLLLFPFSILYGLITWVRNKLFDWGIKPQLNIPFPSIAVGNLSVGGTGKTPHVLLLNQWLSNEFKVFIISRGYGRKTKGLIWANEKSTAETIGDEPMLFNSVEPKPTVIVSEKRRLAINELVEKKISNSIILLDDAFQHRHVKAGFNILLTEYENPFFKDFMLPTGNLREYRSGSKRANCVIVTKCPLPFKSIDKEYFFQKIGRPKDTVYFSAIHYPDFTNWSDTDLPSEIENIVLVSGIANPKPLENHLAQNYTLKTVIFPDHHDFTEPDIERIHEIFGKFASGKTILLTTEKDAMRLEKFKEKGTLNNFPWCIQKITLKIDREQELKDKLLEHVRKI